MRNPKTASRKTPAVKIVVRMQLVPGESRRSFWSWTLFAVSPRGIGVELARASYGYDNREQAKRAARKFRLAVGLDRKSCPIQYTPARVRTLIDAGDV